MNTHKWMSALPDNMKITQINIPGSHDSCACYASFSLISKTQSLTVEKQLEAGVRYFDFRFKFSANEFFATHGIAACKTQKGLFAPKMTAKDVVNCCISFLEKNPSETVLFQLKEAESNTGEGFYSEFFSRFIDNCSEKWYLENKVPVLGDVRGKIVLLRVPCVDKRIFDDSNSGINFSNYPYVGSSAVHDWRRCPINSVTTDEAYTYMFVQDSYKVQGKKKIKTVREFLDFPLSEDEFNICCLNSIGYAIPEISAKMTNGFLGSYLFDSDKVYGIIVLDFANYAICSKIAGLNFNKLQEFCENKN